MRYELEQYGECVDFTEARAIIRRRGVTDVSQDNGALTWTEDRKQRRVEPVFLNNVGWLSPVSEIS